MASGGVLPLFERCTICCPVGSLVQLVQLLTVYTVETFAILNEKLKFDVRKMSINFRGSFEIEMK